MIAMQREWSWFDGSEGDIKIPVIYLYKLEYKRQDVSVWFRNIGFKVTSFIIVYLLEKHSSCVRPSHFNIVNAELFWGIRKIYFQSFYDTEMVWNFPMKVEDSFIVQCQYNEQVLMKYSNSSGAKTGIFQDNLVNIMVLTVQDKQIFVFHKEGFQLSFLSQNW